MKLIIAATAVAAVQLKRGICDGELMDQQGPHWRKTWPQGNTDNGEDDDGVVERFYDGKRKVGRPEPARFVMPDFEVDDDVIGTQASLSLAEGELGRPMDPAVAKDHGLEVLHREFFDTWGHVPKTKFDGKSVSTVNEFVMPAEANPSPWYLEGTD